MPSTVRYGNTAQCQHDSQDDSGDLKTKQEAHMPYRSPEKADQISEYI